MDTHRITNDLIEILRDMTRDWDLEFDGGVGPHTRLIADLGFESIDLVMLVGEIHRHWGRRDLPFQRLFLADGRPVSDVTVGQLAAFLHDVLADGAGRGTSAGA